MSLCRLLYLDCSHQASKAGESEALQDYLGQDFLKCLKIDVISRLGLLRASYAYLARPLLSARPLLRWKVEITIIRASDHDSS